MDWESLFGLSQPLAETVVRGTAIFWFLFLIFRFVIHRDVGAVGVADLLVLVIIADAAQNAMAGEYTSVTDGMILISTIVFWNFLLDWLSFRFPSFGRFARSPPLRLIRNGRMLKRNMSRELMSEDELMSKIREQGVEDVGQVKDAYMESNGSISVIKKDTSKDAQPGSSRTPGAG